MAEYQLYPDKFREELLNADFMVEHMGGIAEKAKAIATEIAPFDSSDPDGRHYRDAFHTSRGKHGGIHNDRAYGMLENDDHTTDANGNDFSVALAVEFGNKNTPAHHTVRDAITEAARQST